MQVVKNALTLLICIALMLSVVGSYATVAIGARATGTVITQTDPLRVRSAPNTSASTIGWAPKGSTVTITDSTSYSGWYQIDFNGSVGYVSSQYVRIDTSSP